MLRALTVSEIEYYLEHMPYIEARKNHASAQLIADLREFIFPRYLDPDPDEKDSKPPRRRQAWTVLETLPPHAKYPEAPPMPREAAQALLGAVDRLPAWVRDVAPVGEAKAVLGPSGPQTGHPGVG